MIKYNNYVTVKSHSQSKPLWLQNQSIMVLADDGGQNHFWLISALTKGIGQNHLGLKISMITCKMEGQLNRNGFRYLDLGWARLELNYYKSFSFRFTEK
jgi:hypothetical protein